MGIRREAKYVYWYIRDYTREHGYAPTYRDIARDFSCSLNTAHHHVDRLVATGKVRRTANVARALVVVA